MRIFLAFATVLLSAGFSSATTIYSVTGTTSSGYGIGTNGIDQMLVSGWTQTGSYTNVSISALLGEGTGAPISAYLTNQIGPGTTVANEIAFTSVSPANFQQTETLFTGLSLGGGTYYLVLAAPGATKSATWWSTASPTVTTDTGVTGNPEAYVNVGGGPDDAFPPASTFSAHSFNLLLTVTGDPASSAPEPSSFVLVGLAGAFLFCAKSRLRR